jgi:hypothetical protein
MGRDRAQRRAARAVAAAVALATAYRVATQRSYVSPDRGRGAGGGGGDRSKPGFEPLSLADASPTRERLRPGSPSAGRRRRWPGATRYHVSRAVGDQFGSGGDPREQGALVGDALGHSDVIADTIADNRGKCTAVAGILVECRFSDNDPGRTDNDPGRTDNDPGRTDNDPRRTDI